MFAMTKAPPKLTKIQAKALEFIRTSLESTGTSPTLRELCAYMGYSAIGSAQDLVAALRRKGFLHTPLKQSARSLVLTPKAIALREPTHQSTASTYVLHCLEALPEGDPLECTDERSGTLRMSVGMFHRPYPSPKTMFALRASGDSMIDAGIIEGDWLVVNKQEEAEPGQFVLASVGGVPTVKRLMKDRQGWYLKPENNAYPIIRPSDEAEIKIIGSILAVQRVFPAAVKAPAPAV
jgi:repressor LexA